MAYYDTKQKEVVLETGDKEFLREQNQNMQNGKYPWSTSIMKSILGKELYQSIKPTKNETNF